MGLRLEGMDLGGRLGDVVAVHAEVRPRVDRDLAGRDEVDETTRRSVDAEELAPVRLDPNGEREPGARVRPTP
jgi:hypothetical protein